MVKDWRYVRKGAGQFHASPKFRIIREPQPPLVKAGQIVGETTNGWKVRFDDAKHRIYLVSKNHAQRADYDEQAKTATFTIPGWLWAKMNGGDDLK